MITWPNAGGNVYAIGGTFVFRLGTPISFATEREAQIAAFDAIHDIRRDTMSKLPPGSTWASEGKIERVDELPDIGTRAREAYRTGRIKFSDLAQWLRG